MECKWWSALQSHPHWERRTNWISATEWTDATDFQIRYWEDSASMCKSRSHTCRAGSICQICMWYNYNCKLEEKRRLQSCKELVQNVPVFLLEGQHVSGQLALALDESLRLSDYPSSIQQNYHGSNFMPYCPNYFLRRSRPTAMLVASAFV